MRPRLPAAHEALAHRSPEAVVQLQDVLRAAARAMVRLVHQRAERREIVLDVVDRLAAIGRRRPRQGRLRRPRGGLLQLVGARHAAGHRAPDLQRVQRRHARPPFAHFNRREGDVQPPCGGADGQPQLQLLQIGPLVLGGQARLQPRSRLVQQQRILARLLRKHALGERRNEDDLERAAAQLRRAGDEDAAVTACGRVRFERRETIREHARRFRQRDRSDAAHRPQIGKDAQHAVRPPQHARRERVEGIEPFGPYGLRGPRRERADDRQREGRQLPHVLDFSRQLIDPRRLRVGALQFPLLQRALLGEPVQPARPAVIARDDACVGEQPLPFPRRAHRPVRRRLPVRRERLRVVSCGVRRDRRSRRTPRRPRRDDCPTRGSAAASGTWPSDRYSANRRADRLSSAHASSARNARPAGCGRRVPRSKYAGTPARSSACSSRPV